MLKQLKKLKAEVTIWQLILASQKPIQLLIDELNKFDSSFENVLEEMIVSITFGEGTITFSNEDLPPRGSMHNNTLYLTVICLQQYLSLIHI